MKLYRLEVGFGLVLLIAGAWVVAQAISYGVLGDNITGAGFFPFISGGLLSVSALGILSRELRGRDQSSETIPLAELLPIGGIILATALFLLLAETVGMILLTPLYVAAVAYLIEVPKTTRGHIIVWSVAVAFAVFAYLLFDYGLNVPIPHGFLGE
jgi:putative tricarboxylic transport membrane protein